jgi:hypothetical protein
MKAIYTLKEKEVDINFINSLKALFKGKTVHITITDETDETSYLLGNKANRDHIMSNLTSTEKKVFTGKGFDTLVDQLSK